MSGFRRCGPCGKDRMFDKWKTCMWCRAHNCLPRRTVRERAQADMQPTYVPLEPCPNCMTFASRDTRTGECPCPKPPPQMRRDCDVDMSSTRRGPRKPKP